MNISKIDFCTNLLLEYFKPSGPINQLTQVTNSFKRPFVQGRIIQGFNIDSQSRVRINLEGIVIAPTSETINRSSFSFECFEVNCFETTLEETRTSLSNICKQTIEVTSITREVEPGVYETTETTIPLRVPSAEPEVHTRPAREPFILNTPVVEIRTRAISTTALDIEAYCDLDTEGFPIHYARGEKDIEGNMYFADFGYIDPLTEDFIVTERNVSFSLAPLDNVLTAISSEILPREVKAVRIKRLNKGALDIIGLVYGQLEDQFYFPHQVLKFNREFTDQDVRLEDLSIDLLTFININSSLDLENRIIYKDKYYSTPEIEFVIQNSFTTLSQLTNSEQGIPQTHSIPSTFKTFTKEDTEYNSIADPNYLREEIKCFEDTCFEEDAFKVFDNTNLVNRSIRNRAIAWAVISFSSFIINYNREDLIQFVINSMSYLLKQKDSRGLFYLGWDQQELRSTYNTSLILNTSIETSTNICIILALLKAFELTQDFNYLLEANSLQENIDKYLVTSNNTFKHSFLIEKESIESSVYTLLYCDIFKDYKKVGPTIEFLSTNLSYINNSLSSFNVVRDSDNVIAEFDNVIIENLEVLDNFNQIFKKTEVDTYNSDLEVLKINYLAYSSIVSLSRFFNVPFIDSLTNIIETIEKRLITNRLEATSLYAASCLINNRSVVDAENNKFNSIVDFNNFKFTKELLFNKSLKAIPTNYSWVDPSILNRKSHLGALLYSVTSAEALNTVRKEFIKRMSSISYMYGVILNRKARDLRLQRIPKEKEEDLKQRIQIELTSVGNNKEDIESKLRFYDTTISIKDNFRLIQSFTGEDADNFTVNWGEGFLSGTQKASNNLYTINIYQPLELDSLELIKQLTPAGIKHKYNEVLRFNIGGVDCGLKTFKRGTQEGCIGFRISEEDSGCINIDLENNDDLANENRGKICREDDETVVEVPDERCDGVLTNQQDIIVTSTGDTICITTITAI